MFASFFNFLIFSLFNINLVNLLTKSLTSVYFKVELSNSATMLNSFGITKGLAYCIASNTTADYSSYFFSRAPEFTRWLSV